MAITRFDRPAELPPIDFGFLAQQKQLGEKKRDAAQANIDEISGLMASLNPAPGNEEWAVEVSSKYNKALSNLADNYDKVPIQQTISAARKLKSEFMNNPEVKTIINNRDYYEKVLAPYMANKENQLAIPGGTMAAYLDPTGKGFKQNKTAYSGTLSYQPFADFNKKYSDYLKEVPARLVDDRGNRLETFIDKNTGLPAYIEKGEIKYVKDNASFQNAIQGLTNVVMQQRDPESMWFKEHAEWNAPGSFNEGLVKNTLEDLSKMYFGTKVEGRDNVGLIPGYTGGGGGGAKKQLTKFSHSPKPAEGQEYSIEGSYKNWDELNMDLGANQQSLEGHNKALYTADPNINFRNTPEYRQAEFIKWPNGKIYSKQDLEAHQFDVSTIDSKEYEYDQLHGSESAFNSSNLEDLGSARQEIIKQALVATGNAGLYKQFVDPNTGEVTLNSKSPDVPTMEEAAQDASYTTLTRILQNRGIDVPKDADLEDLNTMYHKELERLKQTNPDLASDMELNYKKNYAAHKQENYEAIHDIALEKDPEYAAKFEKLQVFKNALDTETQKYYEGYNKIPKGWYFDPENSTIDKEWENTLQLAASDTSAKFLDKKLDPIDVQGKDVLEESGLERIDGFKIESYFLTDKAGVYFKVRPYQGTGKGAKMGNQVTLDIKGDLEQKFMWDYGLANGENDQLIQQKLEHTFKDTGRKRTSIDVDGLKVAVRKADTDGSYEIKVKNPVSGEIETESGITELSEVTGVVRKVLAGNNQFNNDVLLAGILNAENPQMQNVVNDTTGAAAAGIYQMSVKNNLDFFQPLGINSAADLIKLSPSAQKSIASKYVDHIKSEALTIKVEYKDLISELGWNTNDFIAATYFLGGGNLRNWLDVYNNSSLNDANRTIPGYNAKNNLGLDVYLNRVKEGSVKEQQRLKQKYSSK